MTWVGQMAQGGDSSRRSGLRKHRMRLALTLKKRTRRWVVEERGHVSVDAEQRVEARCAAQCVQARRAESVEAGRVQTAEPGDESKVVVEVEGWRVRGLPGVLLLRPLRWV